MASFLERLKKRKLVQWVLAYGAGAFVVFQAVEVLAEPWGISPAGQRVVHIVLLLGLLVTLILAWFHGEKGQQRLGALELLALCSIAVVGGLAVRGVLTGSGSTDVEGAPSIRLAEHSDAGLTLAILPLRNFSGEGSEQMVDWLHEDLINTCGEVLAGLAVVKGRLSVMRFRDGGLSSDEIASQLGGVDFLVDGGAGVVGDSILMRVSLIEAQSGNQRWGGTFTDQTSSIPILQRTVAEAIATGLEVGFEPETSVTGVAPREVDPQALQLFLAGREHLNKMEDYETGFVQAISLFDAALERDSSFVEALSARAMAYFNLAYFHLRPPATEVWPMMRESAEAALAIDPDDPEARLARGLVEMFVDWDWAEAEREFQTVVEANPSDPDARYFYSNLLMFLERDPEAIEQAERARELDPGNPVYAFGAAFVPAMLGRVQEAEEKLALLAEAYPTFSLVPYILAAVRYHQADFSGAVESMEEAIDLVGDGDVADEVAQLGFFLAAAGRPDEARARLRELDALEAEGRYMPPVNRAFIHIGLGETDQALDYLEEHALIRDAWMPHSRLMRRTFFGPIWDEPRFQAILEGMDFP